MTFGHSISVLPQKNRRVKKKVLGLPRRWAVPFRLTPSCYFQEHAPSTSPPEKLFEDYKSCLWFSFGKPEAQFGRRRPFYSLSSQYTLPGNPQTQPNFRSNLSFCTYFPLRRVSRPTEKSQNTESRNENPNSEIENSWILLLSYEYLFPGIEVAATSLLHALWKPKRLKSNVALLGDLLRTFLWVPRGLYDQCVADTSKTHCENPPETHCERLRKTCHRDSLEYWNMLCELLKTHSQYRILTKFGG